MQALSQRLLKEVTAILPVSEEDLLYKGITAAVTERLVELKRADAQFEHRYGSVEELERRIKAVGISPDDHTLYTELLEWRAIGHERGELLRIVGAL